MHLTRLRQVHLLAVLILLSGIAVATDPALSEEIATVASNVSSVSSVSPFKLSTATTVIPDNEHFTPVKLQPGALIRGLSLSGQADLQQTDGAGRSSIGGKTYTWQARYDLKSGCAMLNEPANVLVGVGPANAFIGTNTTAVVHTSPDATRLVNLTDHRRFSLRVAFNKHFIDLDPGFELVLVPKLGRDPKAIAIQEDIGWKDMKEICDGDLCVFVFRVRAADMLQRCHIYRQLNESPLAVDRRLKNELVKTVAALDVMYNKHQGPFAVGTPYGYGVDGRARAHRAPETAITVDLGPN